MDANGDNHLLERHAMRPLVGAQEPKVMITAVRIFAKRHMVRSVRPAIRIDLESCAFPRRPLWSAAA
jgi:hypothetical protein